DAIVEGIQATSRPGGTAASLRSALRVRGSHRTAARARRHCRASTRDLSLRPAHGQGVCLTLAARIRAVSLRQTQGRARNKKFARAFGLVQSLFIFSPGSALAEKLEGYGM